MRKEKELYQKTPGALPGVLFVYGEDRSKIRAGLTSRRPHGLFEKSSGPPVTP